MIQLILENNVVSFVRKNLNVTEHRFTAGENGHQEHHANILDQAMRPITEISSVINSST